MPERFKVVCTMQGAIQVLCFLIYIVKTYDKLPDHFMDKKKGKNCEWLNKKAENRQ